MINTTILDGAMGDELSRRGHTERGGLWSAQALLDAPEAVVELHRDYIAAGATIITTNTYSTVPSYLAKRGMEDRCRELTGLATRLAQRAAASSDRRIQVAGSLPPLDESFRPDLAPPDAEARAVYRQMAEEMAPLVDLFLCETMSSVREARNAASQATELATPRGLPVYVSFTLDEVPGRGLRSGETISEACQGLADLDIAAYLFNCSTPEAIETALGELRSLTDRPIGAYPNRIEKIPAGWTLDNDIKARFREDLSTGLFATWGQRVIEQGASIVGGCCGVGPEDIAALAAALRGHPSS